MSNTIQIATRKVYNIANKVRQNPMRQVYCFDWEMALMPFIFNNI